jgi:8-oxo-dGTP diphosphatase
MKKIIEVVAAVIIYEKKILAFQRGAAKFDYVSYKFEFPGGKVESGEDFKGALKRELNEELGLNAKVGDFVATIKHDYPDFSIKMHCYIVAIDSFNDTLRDHVAYAHVSLPEADALDWIEADRPVLNLLRENFGYVFN